MKELQEKIENFNEERDWDVKKGIHYSSARSKLFSISNKIELSERSDKEYSKSDIIKDIQEVFDELEPIQEKYDYSKLPQKP